MKLAASTGMRLKEAWAQVKAEAGDTTSSPAPSAETEERGTHTLATLKAAQEAW